VITSPTMAATSGRVANGAGEVPADNMVAWPVQARPSHHLMAPGYHGSGYQAGGIGAGEGGGHIEPQTTGGPLWRAGGS